MSVRWPDENRFFITTWAGGVVSYIPGEPKGIESTPTILGVGKYLYPVFDATGSVRLWADGSGNIIARYAIGPYGENLGYFSGARTSIIGYGGYLEDKGGSGLWHTPNRSLTNQGRFLSVDPSGTLNLHDPRTFNQYAYVAGNPINATDPSGLLIIYGSEGISYPEAVEYYEEAKSYVSKSATGRKLLEKIEAAKGDKEFQIFVVPNRGGAFYPPSTNGKDCKLPTIVWNPFQAAKWGERIQSPSIILVHEAAHGAHWLSNPVEFEHESNVNLSPDKKYDNLEERRAQGIANHVAVELGETQIFTHSDGLITSIAVSGPVPNNIGAIKKNILINNEVFKKKRGIQAQ